MTRHTADARPNLFPWWVRAILVLVAFQALLMVAVFFQTGLVKLLVPWTATPLNARFIAALYTSLGLGVLVSAFSRQLVQARIVLVGIGLATALLFIITLPYIPALNPFPTMWMVFYTIDPLLVAFAFWRLRGKWGQAPREWNPLALFWGPQAVFLLGVGLTMLFFPGLAVNLWPWGLSIPLAQLYSAFFVTLGVGYILAALDARWAAAQFLVLSSFGLAVFVLAVSIYHLDRFKPGLPTIIWFAIFGIEAILAGGLTLLFGGLTIFGKLRREPAA